MASVDDIVNVQRPDGQVVPVTRNAYLGIYQYRGYALVDGESGDETRAGDAAGLGKLKRVELEALAANLGILDGANKEVYPNVESLREAITVARGNATSAVEADAGGASDGEGYALVDGESGDETRAGDAG